MNVRYGMSHIVRNSRKQLGFLMPIWTVIYTVATTDMSQKCQRIPGCGMSLKETSDPNTNTVKHLFTLGLCKYNKP
jgi:hypothetical protein